MGFSSSSLLLLLLLLLVLLLLLRKINETSLTYITTSKHFPILLDHVDLDGEVITTCEKHFPQWGDAWKDPRAHLHICDGAQFVRDTPDNTYDVIIQDSSDPWIAGEDGVMQPLPSGTLYEREHICELFRVLKPEGIVNIQVSEKNILVMYA